MSSFLFTASTTVYRIVFSEGIRALYPQDMIWHSMNAINTLLDQQDDEIKSSVQEDLYYNLHYVVQKDDVYFNSDKDLKMTFDQFVSKYQNDGKMMLIWQKDEMPQIFYRDRYFLISQQKIIEDISEMAMSVLQLYTRSDLNKLAFVIEDDLAYYTSMYYSYQNFLSMMNRLMVCFYSALCLFFITLAFSVLKRNSLAVFNETLAQFTMNFWIEVKVVLSLIFVMMSLTLLPLPLSVPLLFWQGYLIINELHYYGFQPFQHNIVVSAREVIHMLSGDYRYERQWLFDFILLVLFEIVCAFVLWTMMFRSGLGIRGILVFVLIFSLAFYVLFRYIRKSMDFFRDTSALAMQIEQIRNGNLDYEVELSENSLMESVSEHLEKIREGVEQQVEEQVKNEKLKIDLITNVSHDLKTPITSLINYSDLLEKADIQPEYAKDYVKIISRKSLRLKNLVQDLFEISKAASGNLQLDMQQVEINGLLIQTLAELQEKIDASGLDFRVSYLPTPGVIEVDGGRLYNVFDNLISNAIKYSLANTRVYIQLFREEGDIVIQIKNIANYELNFDPESLTERFVRGDVSRSTEGSGLGLAIAETFVTLMKGTINISADGDLFKVDIRFREIDNESEKDRKQE